MPKKNILYQAYLVIIISLIFNLLSCDSEKETELDERIMTSAVVNLEKGYDINQLTGDPINLLISPTGDTLITGIQFKVEPKKLLNDTLPPPQVVRTNKGGKSDKEFRLYYYPEHIDTFDLDMNALQVIPVGQGDQHYVKVTSYGDTIQTGVPVRLIPEVVKSKAPIVIKSMPPYYMDNCYSDIQSLDVGQGLKSGYINSFLQDKHKNLWFGTAREGLGRYDGLHFYFYTTEHGLPDDDVGGLVEDKQGNIWMYTRGGLCKFDGHQFYRYTEKQLFFEDLGSLLALDSVGNIWAANSDGGLAKFDGEFFTFYTPKEGLIGGDVRDISVCKDGHLWLAGHGICKFDGTQFTYYLESAGLSADRTTNVFCTEDGRIWATVGDGLIECIQDDKIIKYGKLDGLNVESELKMLFEDSQRNLWIGTPIGVSVFDGEKIQRFSTLEGQMWKAISAIMEDDAGNIWLGTYGSGMHRYKENSFSMLNEYHGLTEDVQFAVHEDSKGNMWFGSRESGVSKFDGQYFTYYTAKDGLAGDRVRWITEDSKGNMWFGTNHEGVSKFNGSAFINYDETNGLSDDIVKCIFEDQRGDIWFATFSGLTRYDGTHFFHYTTTEGLWTPRIWGMVQDESGAIWMATDESGLLKFDGEHFINYTEREGLSTNNLRSIVLDDYGNIWMGTNDKGLIKFNGKTFEYFSEKQGLCNNVVMSVIKDDHNNIWVGTDYGLSVIKNDAPELKEHSIRNYSYVDGLKALDFNTTSAFADSHNNMWFPSGKGVITINADHVNFQHNAPLVQLNYIQLEDAYLDFRDDETKNKYKADYKDVAAFYNYPINPTFHYSNNHLTFCFSAIDWSAPHRIQYSYKLEGLNDEWSHPTSENKVDFRNLSSGDYIFNVRAKGDNGSWSKPLIYPFTISTPIWKTNIAYLLYFSAFVLMILLIIRLRTQRLIAKKVTLEKEIAIATEKLRDQNDQLGLKNTEIEMQKAEVEKQKEIIEVNHQQIKDSILYSQKIQTSLLHSADLIRENYANFFLLFEPKDIVSGDFYFFRTFGDIDYISCVDCTGHGVPGGFMSTLSYLLMDKIIQDDSKLPGEILDELSEALIRTLHQQNPESIQDGMDMSLCRVDRKNRTVQFSGARNGLLLIDDKKVTHFAPDLIPVGGNYMKKGQPISRTFSTKTLEIPKGSWVVLYTDGYVEQLGGKDGLPMRSWEYEAIIFNAVGLKGKSEIKAYLSNQLKVWQGDQIRIDDICLIGFKI